MLLPPVAGASPPGVSADGGPTACLSEYVELVRDMCPKIDRREYATTGSAPPAPLPGNATLYSGMLGCRVPGSMLALRDTFGRRKASGGSHENAASLSTVGSSAASAASAASASAALFRSWSFFLCSCSCTFLRASCCKFAEIHAFSKASRKSL